MDDQKKYLRIAGDDKWKILGLMARHFFFFLSFEFIFSKF